MGALCSPDAEELRQLLDEAYRRYAHRLFVESDPVQVPHRFCHAHDIEISALLVATLAWGNRRSILASMERLLGLMDDSPYEFVMGFGPAEERRLEHFVHRTFNAVDAVAFMRSLRDMYMNYNGLRGVFVDGYRRSGDVVGALRRFREVFCAGHFPQRSGKHVANVGAGAAAKRLNMFLRWMVRPDREGIDFGLWPEIPTSALLIPLDVHTSRVARSLGLLVRRQNDLRAVLELTAALRRLDSMDPVRYDFALFGMGVHGAL
ncbi:MAG: TIGR02757 family protein [Bacteroidales bacterium]|nr:TIGR02757 family protein [Bacteroidales bacterium]